MALVLRDMKDEVTKWEMHTDKPDSTDPSSDASSGASSNERSDASSDGSRDARSDASSGAKTIVINFSRPDGTCRF